MRQTALFIVTLAVAHSVPAHHSDADIDMEGVVAFQGTVTEFHWRNPHVYVLVETIAANFVDTANFTDHRSPYQIGVPSGGQKPEIFAASRDVSWRMR